MLTIKRLLVWLTEMSVFVLLMSALLHLLWGNFSSQPDQSIIRQMTFISGGMVFVLLGSGFFITTAIVGVFWKFRRIWVYPFIAAVLFVFHLQFAASGWTEAEKVPVELYGAAILFSCALAGEWSLSRWVGPRRASTPTKAVE